MADFQLNQKSKLKVKGYADVVFVIDRSGSMTAVFKGLIDHLSVFIQGIQSNPNQVLDWRIAFVAEDNSEFYFKPFTNSVADLKTALERVPLGGSEATLLAIDYATSVEWRETAMRIVSVFTDEPLSGGDFYGESINRMSDLASKLNHLKINLFLFSPGDQNYQDFVKLVQRSTADFKQDFETVVFEGLLKKMGKSISQFSSSQNEKTIPALIFEKEIKNSIQVRKI